MIIKYAVVIEKADKNYSAYVPDLPGCITTGRTIEKVEIEIRNTIELHLEGMKQEGQTIPLPSSVVEYVKVAA